MKPPLRRVAILVVADAMALLSSGCTRPPLVVSWYLTNTIKDDEISGPDVTPLTLSVALHNRGRKLLTIFGVSLVRPGRGEEMRNIADFKSPEETKPVTLHYGDLLVVELEKEVRGPRCSIPMELYVRTGAGKKPQLFPLGGLPTSLTVDMMGCNAAWYRDPDRLRPAVASPAAVPATVTSLPPATP